MSYEEKSIKVVEIDLDHENPRFPPASNQRDAIQSMLDDQGDKIVNLASDIYENGLNPSVRLIVFKNGARYIDGDGNRRLTAIKILETPSLTNSLPKIRKRLDAILKKGGNIPTGVDCVEAISKSVKEDADRRKLNKAKEVSGVELPSNEESSFVLKPGKEAFDDPPATVAT